MTQNYSKTTLAVIALLCCQCLFWWTTTRNMKPDLATIKPLGTEGVQELLSFGDKQFLFRKQAFDIQNAGDRFGQITALRDYDYDHLYRWWTALDKLDYRNHYVPSLASYYFAASQEPARDLPYVIDYLEEHGDISPKDNWWWYSQAIYHAKHRLKDEQRALQIAKKITAVDSSVKMPFWVRQMEAFILEDNGEYEQACEIILNIIDTYEEVDESELSFMIEFIKNRLKDMDENNVDGSTLDPRCEALRRAEFE